MKTCSYCKEVKALEMFRNDKHSRDGKTSRCKRCLSSTTKRRTTGKKNKRTLSEIEHDIEQGTKKCTMCLKRKKLEEFNRHNKARDGKATRCKECMRSLVRKRRKENEDHVKMIYRKSLLKTKYDLTLEGFEALLTVQEKKCAICGKEDLLVVDHNHVTGKVRGLLCSQCNSGLGMLKDSVKTLTKAINYLETRGSYSDKTVENNIGKEKI